MDEQVRRSVEDASGSVKGGDITCHRGGEKLYHQAPLFRINVSANC